MPEPGPARPEGGANELCPERLGIARILADKEVLDAIVPAAGKVEFRLYQGFYGKGVRAFASP